MCYHLSLTPSTGEVTAPPNGKINANKIQEFDNANRPYVVHRLLDTVPFEKDTDKVVLINKDALKDLLLKKFYISCLPDKHPDRHNMGAVTIG